MNTNKILYFDKNFSFKKDSRKSIVFTNGCFDILHLGHLTLLSESKKMGDILIIGLNSDKSVQTLKGPDRPINNELFRAYLLSFFEIVDFVFIFDEETPLELIRQIKPNIIVKGGDYTVNDVIGKEIVENYGGTVIIIPTVQGYSSSNIINKIQKK